jgi:hypothetical protein
MLNLKQKTAAATVDKPQNRRGLLGELDPVCMNQYIPCGRRPEPVGDGDWNPAPDDSPHDVEYGINKKQ